MAIDNTSPNVDEYYVGKGIVTLDPNLLDTWFDVGNVPELEYTPSLEELPHNSARSGTRTRDKTVVIEKSGDLRMVMEEWTAFNMAIILLGDITVTAEDPGPPVIPETHSIDILGKSQFTAGVRFQGRNDVGPRWNFQWNRVDFFPSGSLNPISEEWAGLEVTGRTAATDIGGGVLSFGTAKRYTNGTTVPWPV